MSLYKNTFIALSAGCVLVYEKFPSKPPSPLGEGQDEAIKKGNLSYTLRVLAFAKTRLGFPAFVAFFFLFNSFLVAQNVGINTTGAAPNTNAMLDIDAGSANKGLLIPRLTSAQRNAISAPIPESLLIYNTTTKCFEAWNNTSSTWVAFGCIDCSGPTSVTASASPNPICEGGTLTLTGSATGATSWSWTGPDNFSSSSQNPTIVGITTDGAGVYTLAASNSCGAVIARTASVSFSSCGCPFTDSRDGKSYNTVQIGSQCWMAENLAYLPSVVGPATGSTSVAYYYVYGYNGTDVPTAKATGNYTTYGVLYNWTAAMNGAGSSSSSPSGVQGACPAGWHLPSDAEWCTMENTVEAATDASCNTVGWRGTNTGGDLKETGTTHWTTPNTGATNTSGFTALPGGFRASGGSFLDIGGYGFWWTSLQSGAPTAWDRILGYTEARVQRNSHDKDIGWSVRCVKD